MKKPIVSVLALVLIPAWVFAQDSTRVRKMFEAGQFQQVVDAAQAESEPGVLYTAAQSQQKLGANDQAAELYRQLAERSDADAWHFIGLSGKQLVEGDASAALESARQAVSAEPDSAESHYQLGLVLAKRQNWSEAAAAFDRAADLNPSHAYAYYYGGLMQYRANRPDRMAINFEQFLKLAPEAPERPEVMQIMRTVRGR
jgi:tetratricopeptide (TPR) repeat protein